MVVVSKPAWRGRPERNQQMLKGWMLHFALKRAGAAVTGEAAEGVDQEGVEEAAAGISEEPRQIDTYL